MKLLITGAWKCSEIQKNELTAMGHELIFMQDEKAELPIGAEKADGIICNGLFLYHDESGFKNLKYVQLTSAGYDRVPMVRFAERGVKVNNARGVYSVPMAEFAICGVLDLYKKRRVFENNQKNAVWEKNREITELSGKRVLIVGCGSVGTECAKRFSAFDTCVVGIDPVIGDDPYYSAVYSLDKLDRELAKADIILLTLPITEDTKHLFTDNKFSVLKKDAILVNIGRGAVIDTDAMIKALDNGLIGGAVLDVFEDEPLNKNSQLWKKENVIVTPHNSFVGDGNSQRLWKVIKNNLENFI